MDFVEINVLGIALAALANSVIGGAWYSPLLFANPWLRGMGKAKEDIDLSGANVGYLLTFLGAIVTAYVLSLFIQLFDEVTLGTGAIVGLLAGIGFAVTRELAPTYFEGRNKTLFLISAGYHVTSLTIMGTIIAAFM